MHNLLCLVVFTANILGSFNDPFEFEGNYGEEANPVREYVFDQVVAKEALATNLTDVEILRRMTSKNPSTEEIQHYRQQLVFEAIQKDLQHGPTLNELISSDLIEKLLKKQQELEAHGFSKVDITNFLDFINRYGDQKVFSFFRHSPSELLSLDKILRDQATREGRNFDLPILSSTEALKGESALELKATLLEALFTKDILSSVKSSDQLKQAIEKLDPFFLQQYLGQDAHNADFAVFTTPAGQVFFYWLYQSLNLHLISQNEAMIPEINRVKQLFVNTLGNSTQRAQKFKDQLVASDASVVFTQESDAIVSHLLTEDERFHPVDTQNPADGTFVFLRGDIWEPTYKMIAIDDYEGFARGRLNVILATKKDTGEKFLLASSHGNSTRAEDGRLQIAKIVDKFHHLSKFHQDLQLVIGIDANTKSHEDVQQLRDHLEMLGLVATSVGPTTVKKRMVTTQHAKAGRFAVDEEDYVIILKPEYSGLYQMTHPTVGFQETKPDPTIALPNLDHPSDHYPVSITLVRTQNP